MTFKIWEEKKPTNELKFHRNSFNFIESFVGLCLISATATWDFKRTLIKSESNTHGQDGETNQQAVKSRTVKREVTHFKLNTDTPKKKTPKNVGWKKTSTATG